jgi:hypothetical protein
LSKKSSANSSSSFSSSSSTNNGSQFSKDLCQWMVSSNISLEKLHNQHFRKFWRHTLVILSQVNRC